MFLSDTAWVHPYQPDNNFLTDKCLRCRLGLALLMLHYVCRNIVQNMFGLLPLNLEIKKGEYTRIEHDGSGSTAVV